MPKRKVRRKEGRSPKQYIVNFFSIGKINEMKIIKEMEADFPSNLSWKDVKNPEEYRYREMALHAASKNRHWDAISHSNRGLKINPKSAYLHYMRGKSKGHLGRFEDGIKDLEKARKLKPEHPDTHEEIGHLKKKIGHRDAREHYQKAHRLRKHAIHKFYHK